MPDRSVQRKRRDDLERAATDRISACPVCAPGRPTRLRFKWIFNNLRLPNQRPVVNVVASVVILVSFIPVYIAQRLTQEQPAKMSPPPQGEGREGVAAT